MELIGLSTLDCGRFIVAHNTLVDQVFYRKYIYIPQQTSLDIETRTAINRDLFLSGFDPHNLIKNGDKESNIALDSLVQFSNGSEGYFLMMDLQPSKSPSMQNLIIERLQDQIVPYFGSGFLIETNSSYQFFGVNIVDYNGWIDFLGKSLLMSTVTDIPEQGGKQFLEIPDTRYIGHSMLRRSTGLRITTRGTKIFNPRSIAYVSNNELLTV